MKKLPRPILAELPLAALLALAACVPFASADEKRSAVAKDFWVPDYSWLDKVDSISATKPANLSQSNAPPAPGRKLQIRGTAVQYQVNKRLSIEAGYRAGLAPAIPLSGESGVLPGASSPGAFVRFKRSFGAE